MAAKGMPMSRNAPAAGPSVHHPVTFAEVNQIVGPTFRGGPDCRVPAALFTRDGQDCLPTHGVWPRPVEDASGEDSQQTGLDEVSVTGNALAATTWTNTVAPAVPPQNLYALIAVDRAGEVFTED
jgi:hypothetical protein